MLSAYTETARAVLDPDLLVRVTIFPLTDAVTGDPESELNAEARAVATSVLKVSQLNPAYSVMPFTVT